MGTGTEPQRISSGIGIDPGSEPVPLFHSTQLTLHFSTGQLPEESSDWNPLEAIVRVDPARLDCAVA